MITRRNVRRLLSPLLSAAAMLAYAGPAFGQNPSTWVGGGANGNWNNAANWDVLPASGADTELIFAGTAQLAAVNNFAGAFTLTNVNQNPTATAGAGFVVSGGALTFATGTNAAGISNDANKRLILNNALNIAVPITLGLNANDPNGAELFLGGRLSGTAGVTVQPASDPSTNVVIRSRNNSTFSGSWSVTGSSATMLAAVNALFRGTAISLQSSGNSVFFTGTTTAANVNNDLGIGDTGYNQQLGSLAGAGQFLLGTSGAASAGSTALVGYLGTSTIVNGSASLSGVNAASHFGKVGAGNLTYRSSNSSFNAGISVRQGSFVIDTNGAAAGSIGGTVASQYTVYSGAQLRVNNATAIVNANGRVGNLVNVVTAGGTFRFDGSATANSLSNTEIVGSYTPYAGLSVVSVNSLSTTSGAIVTSGLVFSSFNNQLVRGGQVGFAANNVGLGTSGAASITFTDASAVTATIQGGILPWSLAQTNYAAQAGAAIVFNPDTFATYGANGVAALTTFDGSNVLTAGATVLAGTINSLVIGSTGAASANGTVVTSGAVLSRVAGTLDGSGLTTTSRAYFSATPGTGSLSVTAPVTSAGISTSGTIGLGVLTLTGTNPIISVNSGTTTLNGAVTASSIYQVLPGSTLVVPAGLTVNGAGGTLRGGGTVTGNVTISSGGLIGGTALAGDNGAGQAPGTLTIGGNLQLDPGANFRFYITSIHGDTGGSTTNGLFTQAKILATTLTLTGDYTSSKITIQPWSLDLKNGSGNAPIYDFNNTEEYFWVLGTFSGGITNFTSDKFAVNLGFQNFGTNNPVGSGSYEVLQQGNNLVLHFNPVPEPALMGLAALGFLAIRRSRKA